MPRFRILAAALTSMTLLGGAASGQLAEFEMMVRCPPHGGGSQNPPIADQPIEVTFLVDCSGQTTAEGRAKAARVILQALTKLRSRDTVRIAAFGNRVVPFSPGPIDPHGLSRTGLEQWLRSQPSSGGTNIEAALTWAVQPRLVPNRRGLVILLSDGDATIGERDASTIQANIKNKNISKRAIAIADPEALAPDPLYQRVYGFILSQRVEAIPAVPPPTPPNIDDIWADVFKPAPHPHPYPPICPPTSVPWFDHGPGPLNASQVRALEHFVAVAQRVDVVPEHQDRRPVAPRTMITPDVVVTHFDATEFRRLRHALGGTRPGLAHFPNEILVRVGRTTYLLRAWGC